MRHNGTPDRFLALDLPRDSQDGHRAMRTMETSGAVHSGDRCLPMLFGDERSYHLRMIIPHKNTSSNGYYSAMKMHKGACNNMDEPQMYYAK